jgi:hypothetical protein
MSVALKGLLGGTTATVLSTSEIGGLTNNSKVIGATVYDNTAGSGISSTSGDGYVRGMFIFTPGGTFGGAPTANTGIDIYCIKSIDGGTTYEGGSTTYAPIGSYVGTLPLQPSTAVADNIVMREFFVPACKWKVLAVNNATGQTIPTSSTIKYTPSTDEGV